MTRVGLHYKLQALLDCRALELSVEVACSTPHFLASPSGEGLLTQLLAMFLTFGDSSGPMNLADTLVREREG
jgi:hypothetical protein